MTCNHILVVTSANGYKGVVSTVPPYKNSLLFVDGFG